MKTTVIYIPGLGDRRKFLIFLQRQLLRSWSLYGMKTELFRMYWAGGQQFEDRMGALLQRIDDLASAGNKVVVVGVSAGASSAITAFARRSDSIHAVVTICGQLRGSQHIADSVLVANPVFRASLESMTASYLKLPKRFMGRVMTLRSRVDSIVPPDDSWLDGAYNHIMPVSGHIVGIGFALAYEGWRVARFVRSLGD